MEEDEDSTSILFILFILVVFSLVCVICILVIASQRFKRKPRNVAPPPLKTLIVLGSGGHTAEMLALVSALDEDKYTPVRWVVADTDETSINKLQKESTNPKAEGLVKIFHSSSVDIIPRSREVGQSWFTTIFSTVKASFYAIRLVIKHKPLVIFLNGPGTCIPIAIGGILLRCFYGSGYPKIIFIESFCRVDSLSLSGKILYYLADRFVVQWPQLLVKYPRAQYHGVIF